MKYWIKERDNLSSKPYYVKLGKLPAKEAKRCLNTIHGYNSVHSFDTEAKYEAEVKRLKEAGFNVIER